MKKEIMQKLKYHFVDFGKKVSINNIKSLSIWANSLYSVSDTRSILQFM